MIRLTLNTRTAWALAGHFLRDADDICGMPMEPDNGSECARRAFTAAKIIADCVGAVEAQADVVQVEIPDRYRNTVAHWGFLLDEYGHPLTGGDAA
ncbi:hypothetical protein [Primorskyibacter sp. S87]|uniref:hypothetical protein n=1 Tax=Primorskyibacter sp. S87 TaxID=3415126 RepID=UPI003C79F24E